MEEGLARRGVVERRARRVGRSLQSGEQDRLASGEGGSAHRRRELVEAATGALQLVLERRHVTVETVALGSQRGELGAAGRLLAQRDQREDHCRDRRRQRQRGNEERPAASRGGRRRGARDIVARSRRANGSADAAWAATRSSRTRRVSAVGSTAGAAPSANRPKTSSHSRSSRARSASSARRRSTRSRSSSEMDPDT